MFGTRGSIYGCVDDDYNSCDAIQDTMEQYQPEALILGDVSYTDMDYLRQGELRYLKRPPALGEGVRPEQTLARKKLNKFFQQEIDVS